ncbi:MAG: hypothetical protein WBF33_13425 [Candidatus Nitrosopolaris sp.]
MKGKRGVETTKIVTTAKNVVVITFSVYSIAFKWQSPIHCSWAIIVFRLLYLENTEATTKIIMNIMTTHVTARKISEI